MLYSILSSSPFRHSLGAWGRLFLICQRLHNATMPASLHRQRLVVPHSPSRTCFIPPTSRNHSPDCYDRTHINSLMLAWILLGRVAIFLLTVRDQLILLPR